MSRTANPLNDGEGRLLALLLRIGPASQAEIAGIYAQSPVSGIDGGRRRLRSAIARLESGGLVERDGDPDRVRCSAAGKAAVRDWVMAIGPADLLPEDPLRTKLQSFDLLSREEQLGWAVEARAQLQAHLERLDLYGREVTVPFHALVHDNAVRAMRARIAWLDRLLAFLARPESPSRSPR